MLLAALLAAFFIDVDAGQIPSTGPPPAAELHSLRAKLIDRINKDRAQYNLPPLTADPIAQRAAQYQAENMLATGNLEHTDSSGRAPMQRYNDMGGKADYYGENVGFRAPGVLDPVLLWNVLAKLEAEMMAEVPPNDGHRQNILSSHYNAVGIGVAVGPRGVFMAEDFVGNTPKE
ncbi:MAG: CAP domain-containing protein [Candidatus Eremiobacteraeota bacterium]|nr:CAP domain-containing protein [Candidatus Eremiobacteraeota bacterium]